MAEVEIYTNKGCPACVSAKSYFDRKGVAYIEKKLGKSRKTDAEFSLRTKGAKKYLRFSLITNALADLMI